MMLGFKMPFPLPAYTFFEVWDLQDKVNGKLKHICDGINDLYLSIPSFNEMVCSNSPPTHTLAIEMLNDPAKIFIEI